MSPTIDDLLTAFSAELEQTVNRYTLYVKKAEKIGDPAIVKFFRAIVASESAREKLIRGGIVNHARETHAYFVCPNCGLIFVPEAPDQCPVDETPGTQFEKIS